MSTSSISFLSQTPGSTRMGDTLNDRDAADEMVAAQQRTMPAPLASPKWRDLSTSISTAFQDEETYMRQREKLQQQEKSLAFDFRCKSRATDQEIRANSIIQALRKKDSRDIYNNAMPRAGHQGQQHERFAGDHFLSDVDLINQTSLFDVARSMPKGAHLHVHFNACLPPKVLLNIAKDMERMFISSDQPLTSKEAFDTCELQFSLVCKGKENHGNIFSEAYTDRQHMAFQHFLHEFRDMRTDVEVDTWLVDKLMFSDDEAYNMRQTAHGAWKKFNGRTRMMKGLINYETAYRRYTRLLLEDFTRDGISYAEIRPNFMTSNHLLQDDGDKTIDNAGIMEIIIQVVEEYQREMHAQGGFFGGLKVIYCTPRSFSKDQIAESLQECLDFKKRWPKWIAGFDIIGEEAAGHPLKHFIPEFLQFQQDCAAASVSIPFLFHCGETLDDPEGNLLDALLLGAKRIGHGFALARHPYVMQHMKARGVCLELCPISNEILGLTGRVGGHTMYELLANNVHCTVNSDNGTLFRSSLSHDFYQVMVGKADMGLAGWKQLILWSIEHSCMEDGERLQALEAWQRQWEDFLVWILEVYGPMVESQHDTSH